MKASPIVAPVAISAEIVTTWCGTAQQLIEQHLIPGGGFDWPYGHAFRDYKHRGQTYRIRRVRQPGVVKDGPWVWDYWRVVIKGDRVGRAAQGGISRAIVSNAKASSSLGIHERWDRLTGCNAWSFRLARTGLEALKNPKGRSPELAAAYDKTLQACLLAAWESAAAYVAAGKSL
jgi:hypothetical protein